MYECRCPKDGRKLAEMARPPLHRMNYEHQCECGRWLSGRIILEEETKNILAESSCPCGRKITKVAGYLVTIQCTKCKTFVNF